MPKYESEYDELIALRREYHVTLRVVAALASSVIGKGDHLAISDKLLNEAPDIRAWHDDRRDCIVIALDS